MFLLSPVVGLEGISLPMRLSMLVIYNSKNKYHAKVPCLAAIRLFLSLDWQINMVCLTILALTVLKLGSSLLNNDHIGCVDLFYSLHLLQYKQAIIARFWIKICRHWHVFPSRLYVHLHLYMIVRDDETQWDTFKASVSYIWKEKDVSPHEIWSEGEEGEEGRKAAYVKERKETKSGRYSWPGNRIIVKISNLQDVRQIDRSSLKKKKKKNSSGVLLSKTPRVRAAQEGLLESYARGDTNTQVSKWISARWPEKQTDATPQSLWGDVDWMWKPCEVPPQNLQPNP